MDRDDEIEVLVYDDATPLDQLHTLLFEDHIHHQALVRALQRRASPTSVPFLHKALSDGFDRYAYTASDDHVIAKWFSHALGAIGTPEAIAVIRAFAASANPEIAEQMNYRLWRLGLS